MTETRRLAIAGSTGSVGRQALEVVAGERERFEVVALGACSSVELLARQAREFDVGIVALADSSRVGELEALVPAGTEVRSGPGALGSIASEGGAGVVLNAVVGFAGLDVTVSALESGKRLALANKESLIAGAPVVQRARATPGAEILPVDSEHCAIHQCLAVLGPGAPGTGASASGPPGLGAPGPGASASKVRRLVLTASGGPFRGRSRAELGAVSVGDALSHPTWSMGPKITIDSSTLMNKGLEVLEAHELFGVGVDQIEVVVHPQSIVHSMVELCDGSTIAQLSDPDMRLPIGYCLGYPERLTHAIGALDWSAARSLDFAPPDLETFSCLSLAFAAGRTGGAAPAWLSAANEVAVAAFLEGRIGWLEIADVVAETMDSFEAIELAAIPDVLEADARARALASAIVAARGEAA